MYLDQSKKLVLKGTVNPVVGGASGVDGTVPNLGGDDPAHQWSLLQAWVKNSTDPGSTADYYKLLTAEQFRLCLRQNESRAIPLYQAIRLRVMLLLLLSERTANDMRY